MSGELLSTTRPSALRLAGFFFLAFGAGDAGLGATREWAAVGFPADVEGAVDVSWRGTDVWEGKVALLVAVVALVALVAMRLVRSSTTRRWLASFMIAIGVAAAILPTMAGVRAEDRFGGTQGIDRMAEVLAAEVGLPEDVVREQLADQFERELRVVVGPGLWVTAVGGALIVVGGALAWAWAARRREPADPAAESGST